MRHVWQKRWFALIDAIGDVPWWLMEAYVVIPSWADVAHVERVARREIHPQWVTVGLELRPALGEARMWGYIDPPEERDNFKRKRKDKEVPLWIMGMIGA